MARSIRGRRRLSSRQFRSTPYPLPSYSQGVMEKEGNQKKPSKALEKKDWQDASCSVCMEFPHNAVLLLCSSYDKGCRPYMCGTSYHYSNCLDRFKKAYTKVLSPQDQDLGSGISGRPLSEKSEVTELACPLCRGQVKGWTVVEPAREYLNAKKRSCMQDNCSFVGTYKELRKHVKAEHPSAKPHEVDPVLEQKWRRFEHEREWEDVISTVTSTNPGAVVWGDYVIEGSNSGFETDDEEGGFNGDGNYGSRGGIDGDWLRLMILLETIGHSGDANFASRRRMAQRGYRALEGDGGGTRFSLVASGADVVAGALEGDDEASVTRQGRGIVGRRRRRQRNRGSQG